MYKKTTSINLHPFFIPIGYSKQLEEVVYNPPFRTPEQFNVVRRLTQRSDFNFCCISNIFDPTYATKKDYQGPFMVLWYDNKGNLHGIRIGKRGRILKEIITK